MTLLRSVPVKISDERPKHRSRDVGDADDAEFVGPSLGDAPVPVTEFVRHRDRETGRNEREFRPHDLMPRERS